MQTRDLDSLERKQNKEFLSELIEAKNSEIIFKPAEEWNKKTKPSNNNLNTFLRSSNMNKPWQPYKWSVDINQSYVRNEFYFHNVQAFNPNRTYEHETQVYDPEYADLDWYWESNMPNSYKDTQALDDIDIFTVSSSDTSSFGALTKNIIPICL